MTLFFRHLSRLGVTNLTCDRPVALPTSIAVWLFWLACMATCYFAFRHVPEGTIEGLDKYNHMLAFAVLTFLAANAYGAHRLWRNAERLSLFGAMIELVQSTRYVGRDCDLLDWVADSISIAIVTMILVVASRRWFAR